MIPVSFGVEFLNNLGLYISLNILLSNSDIVLLRANHRW